MNTDDIALDLYRLVMSAVEARRLDQFSKEEWWDVTQRLCPKMSREKFDEWWKEFEQFVIDYERSRMH